MKKSPFTEEQMVKIQQEADRTSGAAVAKAHGVSEQTLYNSDYLDALKAERTKIE
jgi:hypothetical protein